MYLYIFIYRDIIIYILDLYLYIVLNLVKDFIYYLLQSTNGEFKVHFTFNIFKTKL